MTSPTIDTQSLESLLERVKAATGPDRELDRAILDALGTVVKEWDPGDGDIQQWREWADGRRVEITHVSSSLDGCAALQAEVLPGWKYRLTVDPDEPIAIAWLYEPGHQARDVDAEAEHANECLAWLSAILSALIAKGGEAA